MNNSIGNEVLEKYGIIYFADGFFGSFYTKDGSYFQHLEDAISYSEEVLGMDKCCKFMTSKK